MLIVLLAIVLGVIGGLALGGSLRVLAETRLRLGLLALAGLALQLVPVEEKGVGLALLLLSYAFLLVFALANIRNVGFALLALGVALNALVISLNAGMPVTDEALRRAAGTRYEEARRELDVRGGAKHHLAGPDDVLLPLADAIGIGRPVSNVFSVGDLLAYCGVAWALSLATKGPPGKHRARTRRGAIAVEERSARISRDLGLPQRQGEDGPLVPDRAPGWALSAWRRSAARETRDVERGLDP